MKRRRVTREPAALEARTTPPKHVPEGKTREDTRRVKLTLMDAETCQPVCDFMFPSMYNLLSSQEHSTQIF